MKQIGWYFLIGWVCLACSPDKPTAENPAGAGSNETGNIRGIVSYKDDQKTLPDAGTIVYAVSTTNQNPTITPGDQFRNRFFQATADPNGNFVLDNLPADTYTLVFASRQAEKKLDYYQTKYSSVLEPLVSDRPVNNLSGKQARKFRLDQIFKDRQVHVKPEVKLESGLTQVVTQEFIRH